MASPSTELLPQQEAECWLTDNASAVEAAGTLGCTHQAVLVQRARQAVLLEELQALEGKLEASDQQAAGIAALLGRMKSADAQLAVNQEALSYLEKVTSLETAFVSAGHQAMEQALAMSQVGEAVVLEAKRELSEDVHGAWSWVSQLADLNRLHARNAGDYQAFYHGAHELSGLLNSRDTTSAAAIAAVPANGMLGSIKRINTVLTDNFSQFNRLWQLACELQQRSRVVVPLHARFNHEAVPFVGKNVFRFEDGETAIEAGEQVTVIDNCLSHTWTVRRDNGEEVELPSTCIWLPPADPQAQQLALA